MTNTEARHESAVAYDPTAERTAAVKPPVSTAGPFHLTDEDETTVHHYARALVGQAGFTISDVEDIEQELRHDILLRLPKYNPARSKRTTFATRVIEHKCVDLIRHRRAEMRALNMDVQSLQDEVETDEGTVWLVAIVTRADQDRRLNCDVRMNEEARLRRDLAETSAQVPAELRSLCADLQTKTVCEIAAERGMTRFAVYRRLRRLRSWVEKLAAQEYLESTRTNRPSVTYERNRDS